MLGGVEGECEKKVLHGVRREEKMDSPYLLTVADGAWRLGRVLLWVLSRNQQCRTSHKCKL